MESFQQIEKSSLIAVQSILNTRGSIPWQRINQLRLSIGQLSAYETSYILTQTLVSLSERLEKDTPMGNWTHKAIVSLSTTILHRSIRHICQNIEPASETAERLKTIISLFKRLTSCSFKDCGYNDENRVVLLDVFVTMARRSFDQATGISVLPMSTPKKTLVRLPESPKKRPSAHNLIGLARKKYELRNYCGSSECHDELTH